MWKRNISAPKLKRYTAPRVISATNVGVKPSANGSSKAAITFKDWASLTFSLLALTISAGSAYFSIIRQVDDLRVLIDGVLIVRPEKGTGNITIETDQSLNFANLGNRPIAVPIINILVNQFDENSGLAKCGLDHAYRDA
jgi:hypothetical protein